MSDERRPCVWAEDLTGQAGKQYDIANPLRGGAQGGRADAKAAGRDDRHPEAQQIQYMGMGER